MKDPKAIFRKYCKKNHMRYTSERDVIVAEISRENGQFDVDKLFWDIRTKHPKIKLAKASIYRTIPDLFRAGLIKGIGLKKRRVLYEYALRNSLRIRFKCLGCKKTYEVIDKKSQGELYKLFEKKGLKIVWGTHLIGGYCKKCLLKERKEGEVKS